MLGLSFRTTGTNAETPDCSKAVLSDRKQSPMLHSINERIAWIIIIFCIGWAISLDRVTLASNHLCHFQLQHRSTEENIPNRFVQAANADVRTLRE